MRYLKEIVLPSIINISGIALLCLVDWKIALGVILLIWGLKLDNKTN